MKFKKKNEKNAHHVFPEPKVTFQIPVFFFFCLTNSPNPKGIQVTVTSNKSSQLAFLLRKGLKLLISYHN